MQTFKDRKETRLTRAIMSAPYKSPILNEIIMKGEEKISKIGKRAVVRSFNYTEALKHWKFVQ
jgi:hypothetical protein